MNARALSPWALLAALTVAACSAPAGSPEVTITAKPIEIADTGEETTIEVIATDGLGKIGKGQLTITSEAGSLRDGAKFDIDAYGMVRTPFTCAIKDDPYCLDVIGVTAVWIVDGKRGAATVKVKIIPPPPRPWESDVRWDANASSSSCSGMTPAGAEPCTNMMCSHGFSCVDGFCLLNGGAGGLQYTLRFGQSVDLDLHVLEPLADAGVCEVFWLAKNQANAPSTCGAVSSLDLDSNAGCALDNVNIENVIFPNSRARPLPGTYVARVDLWSACMASTPIKWELQVRAGSISKYYCGQFNPADADTGAADAGLTISTITIP
jgi:hypothetical protein